MTASAAPAGAPTLSSPLWEHYSAGRNQEAAAVYATLASPTLDDMLALLWVSHKLADTATVWKAWDAFLAAGGKPAASAYTIVMAQHSTEPGRTVDHLWHHMEAAGVHPSPGCLEALLICKAKTMPSRQLLQWFKDTRARYAHGADVSKVVTSPRIYNVIVGICTRQSLPAAMALEVIDMMSQDGVALNAKQATQMVELALIKSSIKLLSVALARALELGVKLDEGTTVEIMSLWAKRGLWRRMLELEATLSAHWPESQPSDTVLRLLLHAFVKRAHVENVPLAEVFRVLHLMDEKGAAVAAAAAASSLPAPIAPRSAALVVHRLDYLLRSTEMVDQAFYVLEDLREAGARVTVDDLTLVVRGSGRLPDLDRAFATFAEYPSFGLQPDLNAYKELLRACWRAKEPEAALHVLGQMRSARLELDRSTRVLLVNTLAVRHYSAHALELIRDEDEFAPQLLHSVIWALSVDGLTADAERLLARAQAQHAGFRLNANVAQALGQGTSKEHD